MRFSKVKDREFTARYAGERVPDLSKEFIHDEERLTMSFFKKLFSVFKDETNEDETGEDPMNGTGLESLNIRFSKKGIL